MFLQFIELAQSNVLVHCTLHVACTVGARVSCNLTDAHNYTCTGYAGDIYNIANTERKINMINKFERRNVRYC